MRDVSVEHPETSLRVIAILSGEGSGTALLEIPSSNPVSIITDIERRDDITEFEFLWKQDASSMVQVETTNPVLLFPILKAGIPLQTPFEVTDGTATWEVTTSSERLSALGARLEEAGIDFETEYVRDVPSDPATDLLTDRQREALLAATEQGYYDTPRRTTLTEVSESLGISKATGSDVLHRAEEKILKWFIDEYLTVDELLVQ